MEFGCGEDAFYVGAGVHAGGGMALEVNLVSGEIAFTAAEEMVVGNFIEGGGTGEGGNVSADTSDFFAIFVDTGVGFDDHCHGVPANDAFNAAFDFTIT